MMRFIPDTIIGRTVLILLLGLIGSQLIALILYSGDRHNTLAASRGRYAAEGITSIAGLVERTPAAERPQLLSSIHRPGLRVDWSPDAPLVAEAGADRQAETVLSSLLDNLENITPEHIRIAVIDAEKFAPGFNMGHSGGMHRGMQGGRFSQLLQVSLRLTDGSWLNFTTPFESFGRFWTSRLFLAVMLSAAMVTALSVWAVRRFTAPLELFARAAERLGPDVGAPPLPEDGPREVRRASRAFNGMQERLRTFVRDRTHMLAAISHDLRTPITRLKLRAEFVGDDEQRSKMLADLDEMEAMISSTLSFARDDAADEPRKPLDLTALLQSLCDDMADAGHAVACRSGDRIAYKGRPLALRRAFGNLIGNAVTYGGAADVTLKINDGMVTVTVDDDGPGIPAAELERVFAPFHRLEYSRNRETGGVGLGLASARSLIRAHGGDITLTNRPEGGLRATVTLPPA
ncbi:MAG: hypothetical protein A3G18_02490 [Rhodospirillales bacterium RIFCSPLOWO2_12_FULL_58_28]|nr:MAG: hypothetical protein A3H92_06750 [Rhodospirillales bacterium RIFCSPLOWO2_02_FULL_58_16]OHC78921.1 MAG: hypothetical protein A3G18_02490 [Rhodospirillales bacterium RIFCSPLOWO2_12_FULL_58_28]